MTLNNDQSILHIKIPLQQSLILLTFDINKVDVSVRMIIVVNAFLKYFITLYILFLCIINIFLSVILFTHETFRPEGKWCIEVVVHNL